jgi:ArsR family transcriptional regulator, arsenate/arsenite/antimonite-responsive transcriptional repressor
VLVDVSSIANVSTDVNATSSGCQEKPLPTKPVATITADPCCASVLAAPLSDHDADTLAKGFAALADPVRLKLLSLIADAGTICSCDLTGPLGKSQPTGSHHTKILTDAGLIVGEKQGRWVWWTISPEPLEALRTALATQRRNG